MNRKISFPILTKVKVSLFISYLGHFVQKYSTPKMKHVVALLLSILTVSAYGQQKYSYHSTSLTELKGTEYILLKEGNWGKMSPVQGHYLVFINAKNGQSKKVDFPNGTRIEYETQVKIDSLQINKVMVVASMTDLANRKHIDWDAPSRITLLSIDGQEKVQLTHDSFFVQTWRINEKTGNIVVTGHYDTNGSGEYDKGDEFEILLYDLKTAKLVARVS